MPRDNFQYQPTSDNTRRHFDAQAPRQIMCPITASIAPIVQQIAQIKSYTNDYLRELLEGEILGNQRLNEKSSTATIGVVETNIERVQKEAIDKAEQDYAQKVENLNQVSMQNEELDKQLENTRRSENDLQRRFNELEQNMRRLQDESRNLTRDFNQCKQDNTRLEQQATKDKEKHRQELEIHRDNLQKSWEEFRFRLDNEHRQKLSEYERESKNLQRVLDNTRRDLSYAQAKVRELELSREDFEHAVRDELQRTMMAKYRDMVFEIAPERPIPPQTVSLPTRYFSNSTSRPDPSMSNKENGAKCDNPANKHELLKQVITKAVNKRNERRSGLGE
ncbi:unnamed protein product, partial [Mesorhabditis belari]|uniref:Uncharacterized protein n=1 Tax=Mesorhabditis belari TaxID=2138241 RepID=A0AAF3FT80_9BILA